jgi:hypothetical protein
MLRDFRANPEPTLRSRQQAAPQLTDERGNGPGSTRMLANAVAVGRCGGRLCFVPGHHIRAPCARRIPAGAVSPAGELLVSLRLPNPGC